MRSVLFLALLGALCYLCNGQCDNKIMGGTISFNNGKSRANVVQSGGRSGWLHVQGDSLQMPYGPRLYLADKCQDTFSPDMYTRFYLLDKTFSYTVDLSSVGCGCNAALYMISMPAYNSSNRADPTKCGDYYCDANRVCGVYCPEMDIMEANNHALQITPHRCNAIQGKYYPWCDGSGCGKNIERMAANNYGPGSNHVINTESPFQVSMSFQTSNGNLNAIHTIVSQNGKEVRVTHDDANCGGGYLAAMTDAFRQGMVIAFSLWGDSGSEMSWLDVPPCSTNQSCDKKATVTFSNIAVN